MRLNQEKDTKKQRIFRRTFRMNEAELNAFLANCEASGLSGSDLFRVKCCLQKPLRARQHRRLNEQALARILGQLGRWGNNLNQIAHVLNIATKQHTLIVATVLTRKKKQIEKIHEAVNECRDLIRQTLLNHDLKR